MPEVSFQAADVSFEPTQKSNLRKWIFSTAEFEKKQLGEISFVYCSDNYLLEVNKKYLDHNYYTDIITFPYNEGNIISGDLLISIDRIKENALELGVIFENELHRVMIHGVLHLMGYNDKTPDQKAQMTEKEDYYLNLRPF